MAALYPQPGPGMYGVATPEDDLMSRFDSVIHRRPSVPAALAGFGEESLAPQGFNPMGDITTLESTYPKEKRPGLLGRIKQQPGGSRALLALGANLMSSDNFFDGLGQGALAYQTVLDEEAEKLKPQVTKDGYIYTIDPVTGKPTFERGMPAQDEIETADKKLRTQEIAARLRTDATIHGIDTRAAVDREGMSLQDKWKQRELESRERIASLQAEAAERRARITAATSAGKPVAAGVLKQYDEHEGTVQAIDSTLIQAEPVMQALEDGSLQLDVASNLINKGKLASGIGVDDSAVLYGQMNTLIEGIRNTVLMDAKGVQTDGDAERAKAQLLSGTGSAESVKQNLQIVLNNLKRRREYAAARAEDISSQYGMTNTATSRVTSGGGSRSSLKAKYGLE